MLEWVNSWPEWAQGIWFFYVTFHDFIQWAALLAVSYTAWGKRQENKKLEALLEHVHAELHQHIEEDSSFHRDLGQRGMTKGE